MRCTFLRVSLFGLATSVLASCADDATQTTETAAPNGATIIRGEQPLTPPSSAPRDEIIREFLKTRGAGSAVDQLRVVRETTPVNGIVHVTMEQEIDGLRVWDAYVKAAIDSQGQLVQIIDNVVRPKPTATPLTVSTTQALAAALAEHDYEVSTGTLLGTTGTKTLFAAGAFFYREPSVERVAYVEDNGTLREGFLVETWTREDNQLDETLIGHNGHVVEVHARSANDSYNVFVEDPSKGGQVIVTGPGGTVESPAGWLSSSLAHTTQYIRGNNAHAYIDADANNAADTGGTAVTDGNFLAAFDAASDPKTANGKAVAVQNLFYLNNRVHDVLYAGGFDEANGNFQTDNFGRGGLGNDPVRAEAQDGGGTDNANFSTPSDGSPPRMQMYLWTPLGSHEVEASGVSYLAAGASFGPALTTTGLQGSLALASVADGCSAFTGVAGAIAIIDRGTCDFTVKVMNAQNAGAVGAIIANNAGDGVFTMGGTNRKIKIPSVMVGQSSGSALKAVAGTAATMRKDPTPPPMLDGDVDADIVFHEYGHGLTWRMIGSMSGPLAGAIGEGASDVLAFLLDGDDRIGEYSFSDPRGIRRYPYAEYPLTYGSLNSGSREVHNDGEVYAAAMWRLGDLYRAAGLTDQDLLVDWVQGMNYTPAGPAFEDMRDGMLQAAAPERHCLIWTAFAKFGIGVGADGVVTRGGRGVAVTESFAVPPECQ